MVILFSVYVNLLSAQILTDIAAPQNINVVHGTTDHYGCGMSFYDFDNDGWDDLTFPLENTEVAFYKNVNGNYVLLPSMLYSEGQMRELIWIDYDDDGDLDLCATYRDIGVRMYRNEGGFTFNEVTQSIGITDVMNQSFGVSFADPDGDNDLDMYVANYSALTTPSYKNKFYRNNGDGTFTEMSLAAGIDNGEQLSFMGVWFDYDNDDLIDLHVINDKNPFSDALYKNNGDGTFTDQAAAEGVLNQGHDPMTSSISDFDNDGDQDIFVTDLNFNGVVNGALLNNKLFVNQGAGNFDNQAQTMNLENPDLSWGALWVDYNNDGFEDLYVGTSENNGTATEKTSYFYRNESGTDFTLINDSILGDIIKNSPCPVKGDINNDGFYDIAVINHDEVPNILLNTGNTNNSIKITPLVNASNRLACGAKVKVYTGAMTQFQTVFCGSGICAQNSQHMIFGVNNSTVVDSVVVSFPSGITVTEYNLAVDSSYIIHEPINIQNVNIINGVDTLTICPGDSVPIGIGGYTNYLWNNGSTDSIIIVSQPGVYSFQATAGIYTYVQTSDLYVEFEAEPLYEELVGQPVCGMSEYGSVQLNYLNPSDSSNVVNWSNGDAGLYVDSLLPGNYSYSITTSGGCVYDYQVTIVEHDSIDVQFITTPYMDQSGGSVQFYPFGGQGPYTYLLDTTAVGSYVDSLSPGTYSFQVVDANGCSVDVQVVINDESTAAIAKLNSNEFNTYWANDYLWICSDHIKDIQRIELLDMYGKHVELEDWEQVKADCLSNAVSLPAALYHVVIITKEREYSQAVFIR